MFFEKLNPILKGYIKALIPFVNANNLPRTGGSNNAEYCYSAWLRHLCEIQSEYKGVPARVLELGPGDSLGIGIAALISGTESYIGLDIYKYWEPEDNIKIFDELVALYQAKAAPAGPEKFPVLVPELVEYKFPAGLLTVDKLRDSMDSKRLSAIRDELGGLPTENRFIKFFSPWKKEDVPNESVDFIFSQAVLQYVDIDNIYKFFYSWLRPGGLTAHVIDFSSHGITKTWNGHWAFSESEWKHYSFRKKVILNRGNYSAHERRLELNGFRLMKYQRHRKRNTLKRHQLARKFHNISDIDIETHAAYMLSVKT